MVCLDSLRTHPNEQTPFSVLLMGEAQGVNGFAGAKWLSWVSPGSDAGAVLWEQWFSVQPPGFLPARTDNSPTLTPNRRQRHLNTYKSIC